MLQIHDTYACKASSKGALFPVQMFVPEANATNWMTLVHDVLFNLIGLSEADHHWRGETLKKTVQIPIKYIFVLIARVV